MNSLRRQLTRELLLWLALLLGLSLLGIYVALWFELNDSFNSALETRAFGLSALVEQEGETLKIDFAEKIMRGFTRERKARQFYEVLDASGRLVARSPTLGDQRLDVPPDRAGEATTFWDLTLPNGRDGRAVRFSFQPRIVGPAPATPRRAELVVAVDREDLDEVLGGLFAAVAGAGGLLLAGVFFVVPRVLRRGLAPVERLGDHAAQIHADTLTARFETGGLPDELRPIGERLNDLLARLEASFERERRFSADLAHELRTPLAELRSLAECALKWPAARDPASDRDTLAIAAQMEALVTRLLAIARGERGQIAAQPEPLEWAAFVAAVWKPFGARAAERGLRCVLRVAPGEVSADPVLLRSILTNLFDNAVDYAPEGAEIVVERDASGALCVANPAGELAAADVARLFDRFWRKESARSGNQHAGLGLSLAQTFATAMDWRLDAALVEGRIVFRLRPAPAR